MRLKWFSLVCSFLLFAGLAKGQGSVQGTEQVITYTGNTATLAQPGTPANQFNVGGANTFIVPVANPSVSGRVYITNNTSTACAGGFTLQVFSATDPQVGSFNNSPANWQVALLQNPNGGLSSALAISIPANGATYIDTAAISSPKITVQLVNTAASCVGALLEVTVTFTNVTKTVPLISTTNNTPTATSANDVQGIYPAGGNAGAVNPLVNGGAGLATNASFNNNSGLDGFTPVRNTVVAAGSGTYSLTTSPPAVQGPNELAIAVSFGPGDISNSSYNGGWTCNLIAGGCNSSGIVALTMQPATSGGSILQRTYASASTTNNDLATVLLFKTGTIRTGTGITASPFAFNSSLAGDPLWFAMFCTGTPLCTVSSITSSLGNTYQQVTGLTLNNGNNNTGLLVFMTTNVNPGGTDNITVTLGAGTATFAGYEMTGTTVAALTQPSVAQEMDPSGASVIRQDAQAPNLFDCSVTLSTNTTTAVAPTNTGTLGCTPSTVNGVAVRAYITDVQVNTTTAGTATTIQLVGGTGANCGTGTYNLSAITYANTSVGLQTFDFHTGLFGTTGTQTCAKQAGTTAGTSVVEVKGYFAP